MAYITQSDLTEQLSDSQLIQLTDDEKLGEINTDRVSRALASAEGEINGFLATRYAVPVASPPDLIKGWAVALTVYHLWRRRQRVPEDVRKAYEDVIARLRDVAAGKLTLGIDPPPAESSLSNQSEVLSNESNWSRDKLKDF